MKSRVESFAIFTIVVAVALLAGAKEAEGIMCIDTDILSCMLDLSFWHSPSGTCCDSIKKQAPCLCLYAKNPTLRKYVESAPVKAIFAACQIRAFKC